MGGQVPERVTFLGARNAYFRLVNFAVCYSVEMHKAAALALSLLGSSRSQVGKSSGATSTCIA